MSYHTIELTDVNSDRRYISHVMDDAEVPREYVKRIIGDHMIDRVRLTDKILMIVRADGLIDSESRYNPLASLLYGDSIFGPAILCSEGIINGVPDIMSLTTEQWHHCIVDLLPPGDAWAI